MRKLPFFTPIGRKTVAGSKTKPVLYSLMFVFERIEALSLEVTGMAAEYVPAVMRMGWSWLKEI
jgi:hypothetical protein